MGGEAGVARGDAGRRLDGLALAGEAQGAARTVAGVGGDAAADGAATGRRSSCSSASR